MKDSKGTSASSNLYAVYRLNARNRSLVFGISKTEFLSLTKQDCYYCGSSPHRVHKTVYGVKPDGTNYIAYYTYNGVDRYDNSKGYNLENCVPCCFTCNKAKGTMTPDEFIEMATKVFLTQNITG